MEWILKIDDGICILNDFNKAINIIKDEMLDYFNNEQVYSDRVPFFVGALECELYDEEIIKDEDIVAFGRIKMLLNRLFKNINFINHNYIFEYIDEYKYDFKIIKNNDDIILDLNLINDCYNCYLKTNMFNLNESKELYFYAKEVVVTKLKDDKYNLGDEISININLKKKDVWVINSHVNVRIYFHFVAINFKW